MLGLFVDIETTGLDPMLHAPIDIAILAVDLNDCKLLDTYQSLICQSRQAWEKSDPESLQVNGYTFEAISGGKSPDRAAEEIIDFFNRLGVKRGEALFICQNPAFDRSFFNQLISVYEQESFGWPYHWLDLASMYWNTLKSPYPKPMSLSKNTIAKVYGIAPEERPHHAIRGAEHLFLCYKAVNQGSTT